MFPPFSLKSGRDKNDLHFLQKIHVLAPYALVVIWNCRKTSRATVCINCCTYYHFRQCRIYICTINLSRRNITCKRLSKQSCSPLHLLRHRLHHFLTLQALCDWSRKNLENEIDDFAFFRKNYKSSLQNAEQNILRTQIVITTLVLTVTGPQNFKTSSWRRKNMHNASWKALCKSNILLLEFPTEIWENR